MTITEQPARTPTLHRGSRVSTSVRTVQDPAAWESLVAEQRHRSAVEARAHGMRLTGREVEPVVEYWRLEAHERMTLVTREDLADVVVAAFAFEIEPDPDIPDPNSVLVDAQVALHSYVEVTVHDVSLDIQERGQRGMDLARAAQQYAAQQIAEERADVRVDPEIVQIAFTPPNLVTYRFQVEQP